MVSHPSEPNVRKPRGQAEAQPEPQERVARALARAGVASRREVERMIEEGRVALNGQVLPAPGAPAVAPGASEVPAGAMARSAA